MNRRPLFLYSCLCFGFAFFYVPILSMIVYSFNRSRLATDRKSTRLNSSH